MDASAVKGKPPGSGYEMMNREGEEQRKRPIICGPL